MTVTASNRNHNDRLAELVCEAMWPLLDAVKDYLAAHEDHDCGDDCQSDEQQYEDIWALGHYLTGAESCLTCTLVFWAGHCRRTAKEYRREGRTDGAEYWEEAAAKYEREEEDDCETETLPDVLVRAG